MIPDDVGRSLGRTQGQLSDDPSAGRFAQAFGRTPSGDLSCPLRDGGIAKPVSYQLGIDLGTTYTAAAIHRDDRSTIFSLGDRSAAIPSVVLLRDDGTVLTGDAAERRAVTEPERVAREFKRRLGDTTPIIVGGSPYSSEALMARLLRSVVDAVEKREGEAATRIAISHPANWGPYKIDLLTQAVTLANLDPDSVCFLTEPEAAAISYASQERIDPGAVVAVYDLGGGTFDAAMLRRTDNGFEIIGRPEGIERLGGIDFDAAVFAHVSRALDGAIQQLDPEDPTALAAVARLRADCVEAKEALSADTDATIPVLLPNVQTEVRLTRREFEGLIRPSLVDSIEAMRRAVRSAGLEMDDVSRVLLVGGSSRVPLIAQMVSSELGRPIAVDAHPKHAIALGASYFAASDTGSDMATPPPADAAATPPAGIPPVTIDEPPAPEAPAEAPPSIFEDDPVPDAPAPTTPVVSSSPPPTGAPVERPAPAASASEPEPTPEPEPVAPRSSSISEPPPRLVDTPSEPAPLTSPGEVEPTGGGRGMLIGAIAVAAVVIIGGIFAATQLGGDDAAADGPETSEVAGDETSGTTASTVAGDDTADDTTTTTAAVARSDAEIQAAASAAATAVTDEVTALGLFTDEPTVVVNDGVAIVAGTMFDPPTRLAVVKAVEDVDGVTNVIDDMFVQAEDERCTIAIQNNERFACITEATWDGTNISATIHSDSGPQPFDIGSTYHMHIFGDDVAPETAGAAGDASVGGGTWQVWDDGESFVSTPGKVFTGGVIPERICVRIATPTHTLDSLRTGNCWPIDDLTAS